MLLLFSFRKEKPFSSTYNYDEIGVFLIYPFFPLHSFLRFISISHLSTFEIPLRFVSFFIKTTRTPKNYLSSL